MQLLINSELSMPLGKQVSQMAHAYCAFVLGCYNFNQHQFKCKKEDLQNLLINSQISYILSSQMQEASIQIVDNAHTVFKEPTLTTALNLTDNELQLTAYQHNSHVEQSNTDVRMVLIVDKSYRKGINKQHFLKESSLTYAEGLIPILENLKDHKIHLNTIMQWVQGSFAKITLNCENIKDIPISTQYLSYQKEGYLLLGPLYKKEQELILPKNLKLL